MFELVKSPKTDEVFLLDIEHQLIHGIDQAAFGVDRHYCQYSVVGWERLELKREVESVADWRIDPGKYSNAHYVVAKLRIGDGKPFTVGGSIVVLKGWRLEMERLGVEYSIELCALYDDPNLARQFAEVAW